LRRGTQGFSSEKFTKVDHGNLKSRNRFGSSSRCSHPRLSQELRGAEILVKALQAEGVKYIWGYPGGAVLHIYDAFYKQDTIQHVLVRHEQAAVHAADGYARATGDVGVALVTSGPGVTNAVTGIATAYMDSIPMVIITGQVPTHAIGLDAFQECDTVGITRPIVKHNFLVKDVRDMADVMKKAFHIARSGRPGPVVVDIPKDVSFNKTPTRVPRAVEMRSYNPVRKGHGGQIRKALQLLLTAKRPYIYTGGGVLAGQCLRRVAHAGGHAGLPGHQHA
jgi:acetolactate synthase-1/2/3 large subunit